MRVFCKIIMYHSAVLMVMFPESDYPWKKHSDGTATELSIKLQMWM